VARLLSITLAAVLAGCATHPGPFDQARRGPYYKPLNYVRDKTLPAGGSSGGSRFCGGA